MGLRDRYKAVKYLNAMEKVVLEAGRQYPDGSLGQQYYTGIIVAVREKLGDRPGPIHPQARLDEMTPAMGWGWLPTQLFVDQVEANTSGFAEPYELPTVPTPEELEEWGRPRMPLTVLHESFDSLDSALRIIKGESIKTQEPQDFSVETLLDDALQGFSQLQEWDAKPQEVIDPLADSCGKLAAALQADDPNRLRQATEDADTSLLAARIMLKK